MKVLMAHSLGYRPAVYGNCVHTQYAALAERHIKDRSYIGFDAQHFRKITSKLKKKFVQRLGKGFVPYPGQAIVDGYSGSKKAVYARAWVNVVHRGFDKRWTHVKMFVKPDKIPSCEIEDKSPRAIQYRAPEFNLLLARYLKPYEEAVYKLDNSGLRIFAKGRNLQQRAADIIDAYNSIPDCVVIEADHSKFDSCVTVEHLKFLHSLYLAAYNKSYKLKFLLNHQLNNKGSSEFLKYKVKGTRMSGDFDTALGNSILNYFVLVCSLKEAGIKKFHVYIDGDDSLIFMSRVESKLFNNVNFSKMGFETKWEVKDLITAEFCKAHVIRSNPPILARNPERVIAHLQVCLKEYGPTTWPELLQGKLVCEFWANQGVPYLQKWLTTKLDKSLPFRIPVEELRRWGEVKTHVLGEVTQQAYLDLYTAYGLGAEFQTLLYTPVASAFPESVKLEKHSKRSKYTRRRYVWTIESIHNVWATFSTLDCSPSLRGGASCRCRDIQPGGKCGELALPKTSH